MRTNYERVKVVLDRLNDAAAKAGVKKIDAKVIDRLKELTGEFRRLTTKVRNPIDYSSPITHIAYAFRSLTCHAHLLYRTLVGIRKDAQRAFGTDVIKVACIGGGPGADALGMVKFLERWGPKDRPVEFYFIDREPAWKAVRDVLFPTFDSIQCKRKFIRFSQRRHSACGLRTADR